LHIAPTKKANKAAQTPQEYQMMAIRTIAAIIPRYGLGL
jgi:hypothetical protein